MYNHRTSENIYIILKAKVDCDIVTNNRNVLRNNISTIFSFWRQSYWNDTSCTVWLKLTSSRKLLSYINLQGKSMYALFFINFKQDKKRYNLYLDIILYKCYIIQNGIYSLIFRNADVKICNTVTNVGSVKSI